MPLYALTDLSVVVRYKHSFPFSRKTYTILPLKGSTGVGEEKIILLLLVLRWPYKMELMELMASPY